MADHLGFLIAQTTHIEEEAYRIVYPEIQYPRLVPVVTEGNPWARSVTYFSMDMVGEAQPLTGRSTDIPVADITHAKHEVRQELFGIGYDYSIEELAQAQMLNMDLTSEKAASARLAAEKYIDNIFLNGSADHAWDGFLDAPGGGSQGDVPTADKWVSGGGSGSKIIAQVNDLLSGVWTNTQTVEMADTLALPPSAYNYLANTPRSDDSDMSLFEWIMRHNVWTAMTGTPLTVTYVRGLENKPATGKGRVIAYRRDPQVCRLYMPMPHQFLEPEKWGFVYRVPGIFRLGGFEIRRPGAFRKLDKVLAD